MALQNTFDYVRGLIEVKADRANVKTGQNLLELLSLSLVSSYKKGVVLLATNCSDTWEIFHFATANTIQRQVYVHGSKAREDFMQLIDSVTERVQPEKLWIAGLPEVDEQNLEGFDELSSERDKKRTKAEQDEAMLESFADRMADLYGERPTVPSWARANARVPDYYT